MDIYEIRRQNLRALIKEQFDGKISSLADAIERAPSYLSRCLTENPDHRKRVGEKLARDIEAKVLLPELWLDQPRDESLPAFPNSTLPRRDIISEGTLHDISAWDESTPLNDDEVEVPFLREVELAAGSGRFAIEEDEIETLRFSKKNLRKNNVQFDKAKCVTVRGNSMIPVLRDGATVGIDMGKTSMGSIIDGDLYALNHNGQLRVKQLYRLPTGIRLRSFNRDEHPDEDYSFQYIQDEQISILGHVFWWAMYAK